MAMAKEVIRMAWRPTRFLKEGELDNTVHGKVTGWMAFAGMREKVTLDLEGDFHRDIRGAKIRFKDEGRDDDVEAASYMRGFAAEQTGQGGDITAGLPPHDYGSEPYIEWYGNDSGRVVLELEPGEVRVVEGPAWQPEEGEDLDETRREASKKQFTGFVGGLAKDMDCPVGVVGDAPKARRRIPPVSRN